MLKTKIICTIGPVTESKSQLKKLVKAGMNVARLNFSHASFDWGKMVINRIKEINKTLIHPVAILLDTKGPEIRTNNIKGKLHLESGDSVTLAFGSVCDDKESHSKLKKIGVSYEKMIHDLKKGDIVMLDSGLIQIKISRKGRNCLYGKVLNKGDLTNKRHINLPGIKVDLPSITNKDKQDIEFGIKMDVDYIALSFVRSAADIEYLRKFLLKRKSQTKIIAKVEDRQAVNNIENIIKVVDGVMVARGDLGIEIPMEDVPIVQKKIIQLCLMNSKPVIVATHLLESMIENPVPTRAEVTDITLAVWEKTDAIMLSGETTAGRYPIKAVKMMAKVAVRGEKEMPPDILHNCSSTSANQELARSACLVATNLKVKAIIVPTLTGKMAINVSNFRTKVPIIALCNSRKVQRELSLVWGIQSILIPFYKKNPEKTLLIAFKYLKKNNLLKLKDPIVVISNVLAGKKVVEAVEVRNVI